MTQIYLEHVNLTVADPDRIAAILVRLCDWRVRWSGPSLDNGHTVHVGSESSYVALYTHPQTNNTAPENHLVLGHLNHVGVVVDDLDAAELRVRNEGLEPHSFRDYAPEPGGRRFYVNLTDTLELEVVSYG